MSRCAATPPRRVNRTIILAWQADVEAAFPQLSPPSLSYPILPSPGNAILSPKRRRPLEAIDPNMEGSPKKRNTKAKILQEIDPDPTPRAQKRLVSRRYGQQESPTGLTRRNRQHQEAEMGLDGILEMDDLPDLRPASLGYAEALQSSSAVSTSESSTTSKRSSRASSPVKKKADLKLGRLKSEYKGTARTVNVLPADIRDLYGKLKKICQGQEIIPQQAKELVEEVDDVNLFPQMTFADSRDKDAVLSEFQLIGSILEKNEDCSLREKMEPSWNEEVHRPILDLALRGQADVSVDNVTLAQIAPDFVPLVASDKTNASDKKVNMQSKMVDYTINLVLPSPSLEALHKFFASLPSYNEHTLNQTTYAAVRERPAAISIETKVDNPNDPMTQLAIWASAWHNRIRWIAPSARIVTLPLMVIRKDGWSVSFFCDHGDKVEIWDYPDSIGHTKTATSVYKLLAALRSLAEWVREVYKAWFEATIMPTIQASAATTQT